MKFLAFQHVPWETPGLIRTAAEAAGHTMEVLHPADWPRAHIGESIKAAPTATRKSPRTHMPVRIPRKEFVVTQTLHIGF